MCFAEDGISFQKLLNQFYSSRLKRKQIIGHFSDYEEKVENIEGPAFYCEYQFYNQFTTFDQELKDNYNQTHFFGILTTPYYGRNSLRNRHLAAGMAICFILNNHVDNWQSEYYSQSLSLYDFFISKFKSQKEKLETDQMYFDLSKFHTHQVVLEHKVSFDKFNAQEGVKVTLEFNSTPQFEGFDPMNAESINDSTVLHKTFLKLAKGESNKLFITNKNVVTISHGQVWFVKKVVLFVPEENIILENNRITVDTEREKISWSGNLELKSKKKIIFNCE